MSSISDVDADSSTYSPLLFTPPPMAPMPPLPPFSRTAMCTNSNGIHTDVTFLDNDPESDGQRAYRYACSIIPDSLENYLCVSYQRKVEPIIHSGPQYGLVALAMVDSVLHKDITVEQLCKDSQTQGFSKHGEIFSVHYLESLSAQAYGCRTSILDVRDVGGKWEFLNCLARGDLLLVPYDPDKNYVPVLKKGHKAHWALVTGFFAAIIDENALEMFHHASTKNDCDISNLYHCSAPPLPSHSFNIRPAQLNVTPRALSAIVPLCSHAALSTNRAISAKSLPSDCNVAQKLSRNTIELSHNVGNLSNDTVLGNSGTSRNPLEAASYIFVYAKQGKSKATGIWNAKTLVESCCNLIRINTLRLDDSCMFPDQCLEEELCGKIVVLHMK